MKRIILLLILVTLASCEKDDACNCSKNTYDLYYDENRMQQRTLIESEPVECQEEYDYEYGGLFAITVKCD